MQADLPHTLFNPADVVSMEDIDEATRLTLAAMEEKRRNHGEEKSYTLDEIFDGAAD